LWDINVQKRRSNGGMSQTSACDWTLNDYYEVAKRCIGAFAVGSLAQSMLRNEDAISFVAEHLMYGAHKWSETGGRTVNSYLNQCAIWSIQRWITLSKKTHKHEMVSLNDDCRGSCSQRHEIIADDKSLTPDSIVSHQEQSMHLIEDFGLTTRQRHCLEVVYIQGQRPSDVARDLGISRQAVDQCLRKGTHKIRVVIDDKEKESLFA
jgi:DNA-directed RNA polymerase specialized sigma subunit